MAGNTIKCRLMSGKHSVINSKGEREMLKVGDVAELTPRQYEAFKDKFKSWDEYKAGIDVDKAAAKAAEKVAKDAEDAEEDDEEDDTPPATSKDGKAAATTKPAAAPTK